jgi:hypothetical protein
VGSGADPVTAVLNLILLIAVMLVAAVLAGVPCPV